MRNLMNIRRELFVSFVAIVASLAIIPIMTYLYFARDLQTKEGIMNNKDTGIILLDRNNEPFFTLNQANVKSNVTLAQIPKHTIDAIIVSEDREYYTHPGFSIRGIVRSLVTDVKNKELSSGGSTITQQLVKYSLLTPTKSFLRKYQEVVLAQEIERRYTKDEILEMYLNSAYFGHGSFGVNEAAKTYFSKEAKDLNLAESAVLAAILPAPGKYSPFSGDKQALMDRQKIILENMAKIGYITKEEREKSGNQELAFDSIDENLNSIAPHFAFMVREELKEKYGEEYIIRSGMKVRTTLDSKWQRFAEKTVADNVKRLARNRVTNAAAVVMDPKTGEIKALVGSYNWGDEKFGKLNVTTAPRQPGSSFKPIIYAGALEKKIITPATVLKDEPITYNIPGSRPYSPVNYDKKFRGNVLVRRALANSLNVPAIEVMNKLGVEEGVEVAQKFGLSTIDDPKKFGLSMVLGAGEVKLVELTSAYSVFANKGLRAEPTTILDIEDKFNRKIYTHQANPKPVISPEVAFLISSILSDVRARAEQFGDVLNISRVAAVKTGTTNDYRDSLTVGFTPSLVVGVWVGNNNNLAMDNVAGSLGAAPIWKALMEKFLAGTLAENFEPPSGINKLLVCGGNGLISTQATSSAYQEYFLRGTEPKGTCVIPTPPPNQASVPSGENSQPEQKPEEKPAEEPKEEKKEEKKEERRSEDSSVTQSTSEITITYED